MTVQRSLPRWIRACGLAGLCVLACGGASSTPGSANDAAANPDAASQTEADAGSDSASDAVEDSALGPFVLESPAFVDAGVLPAKYTCDSGGASPPFSWRGAPKGTTEFALLMTTLARDGLKWNWVLHSIPAGVAALAESTTGVGTAGLTSDGPALAYSAPCSQGPGAKNYTFSLYALSDHPVLPAVPNQVTGDVLTRAIEPLTLAKSTITVSYTRP